MDTDGYEEIQNKLQYNKFELPARLEGRIHEGIEVDDRQTKSRTAPPGIKGILVAETKTSAYTWLRLILKNH